MTIRQIPEVLAVLVLVLALATPAAAFSPERDIVAVVSAEPLSAAEDMPGLLTGRRFEHALQDALEMVRGEVPEAARPGLEALLRELSAMASGDLPGGRLPASYWVAGQAWLPVRVEQLRVELDAPDLIPRARAGNEGGQVSNLPARARRSVWLPVAGTAQRAGQALAMLAAGESGRLRAQAALEDALRDLRSRVELEDRPLVLAYYQVEAALASLPNWNDALRGDLRAAAESLNGAAEFGELADQLQAQADQLAPDLHGLQGLALALRRRLESLAGTAPGSEVAVP